MTGDHPVGRPVRAGVRRPTLTDLEQPKRRGKPRTSGDLTCDRSGRETAKIRVHWPDGAICGICFTEAVHTYGTCPWCRSERLLPGRSPQGENICRDCAGIVRPLMTCDQCGTEAERFRGGRCIRCVIEGDLEAILKPNAPADLRLKKLIAALLESRRPESIHTWMQGAKVKQLLTMIGNRELELTHEGFDSLPRSPAVEHLREILVHNRLMEIPADHYLRRFEHWLQVRLDDLAPYPEIATMIEQFGRWHHSPRLSRLAGDPGKNLDAPTRNAKQEITEAGKFLIWLHDEHGTTPRGMTQWHIDLYLDGGTSTRKAIRNFIAWYRKGRGGKRKLYVPPRYAQTMPTLNQAQRLQLIRNAIEMDQVALGTRIAALIHLLWATPLVKIVMLRTDDVVLSPTGMTITIGATPAVIPEPLAPLFWAFLTNEANQQTVNVGTDWLFPGYQAGHPILAHTLQRRLLVLGIDPQRARNASLKNLTAQIDIHTLAGLLGYSPITLANHADQSGTYMSAYVEAKRKARAVGEPVRTRFIPGTNTASPG
jgi:hypothetical protein